MTLEAHVVLHMQEVTTAANEVGTEATIVAMGEIEEVLRIRRYQQSLHQAMMLAAGNLEAVIIRMCQLEGSLMVANLEVAHHLEDRLADQMSIHISRATGRKRDHRGKAAVGGGLREDPDLMH